MIPGLSQFPEGQIVGFVLLLLRMLAFVVAMPIFGAPSVPVPVKVLFSLTLSVVLFPIVVIKSGSNLAISEMVILWAMREVVIGLFLGFVVRMFFFAVSVAGELIGVSSGLSAAQIFNPSLGTNSNIIEQFQVLLATLLFLALNGHHFFLQAIVQSYDMLPIGVFSLKIEAMGAVGLMLRDVIIFGVKMASPIIVSVFLTHLAMGIIGRAVPQINVLVTSLQVTILMTLGVLVIIVPATLLSMNDLLTEMADQMMRAMHSL